MTKGTLALVWLVIFNLWRWWDGIGVSEALLWAVGVQSQPPKF